MKTIDRPRLTTAGVTVLFLFQALFTATSQATEILQQAETAWAHREQSGETQRAITLWEQDLQEHPDHTPVLIHLTKACGRATRHAATQKDQRYWAGKARDYGVLAIQQNPTNANAYAYYGEALAQWARANKGVHSLSAVRQAVAMLNRAIVLNPRQAYAHMILAEIYRHSPRWPLSVGDKKKGMEHARLAVETGPDYAINHLVLAKALLAEGQKTAARQELEMILQLKPPTDAVPETRSDQETARELLKGL